MTSEPIMSMRQPMRKRRYSVTSFMVDPMVAPSRWETVLLFNNVSHWLGASLESPLVISHWLGAYTEWFPCQCVTRSQWIEKSIASYVQTMTQNSQTYATGVIVSNIGLSVWLRNMGRVIWWLRVKYMLILNDTSPSAIEKNVLDEWLYQSLLSTTSSELNPLY